MYWTDWGSDAKIERASMDGTSRTVLHTEDLVWPNGLALDYPEQRLYWADAFLDKIEYSNADGTGRQVLETAADGLVHPFDLTIAETLLVWTEWSVDSIFAAHKLHGGNFTTIYSGLFLNPDGIEAITPDRQPNVMGKALFVCEHNHCKNQLVYLIRTCYLSCIRILYKSLQQTPHSKSIPGHFHCDHDVL